MSTAAAQKIETIPEKTTSVAIDAQYLFETIVCDVHSCAMLIGAVSVMLAFASRPGMGRTLRSCRHLLHDDAQIMALALRYGDEAGLSRDVVSALSAIYREVGEAKRRIAPLLKAEERGQRRDLLPACEQEWRRLAGAMSVAVGKLGALARSRLPALYADDAATLREFLSEAVNASCVRVDDGVIRLPTLKQRRENPRHQKVVDCLVVLPNGRYRAQLRDVSRNGLGLQCDAPLTMGQTLFVELEGGRRLEATVARRQGQNVGLSLSTPLSASDSLFRGGAAR